MNLLKRGLTISLIISFIFSNICVMALQATDRQANYFNYMKTYDSRTLPWLETQLELPNKVLYYAAEYACFYKYTNDESYLNFSKQILTLELNDMKTPPERAERYSCFALYPLMQAYDILNEENLITAEERQQILDYTIEYANRYKNIFMDENQSLSIISGIAYASELFPDNTNAAQWRATVQTSWDYWYAKKDANENSGSYASIGVNSIIKIAIHMGWEQQLNNADIKKWLSRYRDMVSPAGAMPEYGEDYWGAMAPWIYTFEYAANLFEDPSFITVANKIYDFVANNRENIVDGAASSIICDVLLMPSLYTAEATPLTANTAVLTRNEPGHPNAIDKIIMGPSKTLGKPNVMYELYGRGGHANVNFIGAMQYYEYDNVPLFHGAYRGASSVIQSNNVIMQSQGQQLVQPNPTYSFNGWKEVSVPTRLLVPDENGNVTFEKLTLRLTTDKNVQVFIDNMYLEGVNGTLVLDNFDGTSPQFPSSNYTIDTTEKVEGIGSVRIDLTPGTRFANGVVKYDSEFNVSDYPILKYSYRFKEIAGSENPNVSFVFRTFALDSVGTSTMVDSMPTQVLNVPKLITATANLTGEDSYSSFVLDEYYTVDSSLKRQSVLTEEGILVVRDRVTVGALAAGYRVGSVWQLHNTITSTGTNWYDSPVDDYTWIAQDGTTHKQSLLVFMQNTPERTFSSVPQYLLGTGGHNHTLNSVYSSEVVSGNTQKDFITVLIPHNSAVQASTLANSITIENSTVTIGDDISITIGDDTWSVTRQ